MIEYLVDYACVLAGGARPFDEAAIQELVRRDVERAHNIAASENHGLGAAGELPTPGDRGWLPDRANVRDSD